MEKVDSSPVLNKKPLIAFFPQTNYDPITRTYFIPEHLIERNNLYKLGITKFGGEILTLDYSTPLEVLNDIDGFLIPGGADIDPFNYGHEKNENTKPHPLSNKRYEMEKKIFNLIPKEVPIFGICYGAQLLNVLRGGTLKQHVENHRNGAKHEILIEKDSKLFELVGEQKMVSHCNHHQIVKKIGENLKVNCVDDKGMIHGLENSEEGRWIVTVQWHPERAQDELNVGMFEKYVAKCREYKEKRNLTKKTSFL